MEIGAEVQDEIWDVIVVGTGVGGGTFGLKMAQSGKKVLFCDAGLVASDSDRALTGQYLESVMWKAWPRDAREREAMFRRGGRVPEALEAFGAKGKQQFVPFMGAVLGGSSALYGMVLERFFPIDFTPLRAHGAAAGNSLLAEEWPIPYEAFEPWYEQAEKLYEVKGELDPLKAATVTRNGMAEIKEMFHPANRRLAKGLVGKGFHPYRLPLAQRRVQDCKGCQGYLCDRQCKVDSWSACVKPALDDYNARLITGCRVMEVLTDGRRAVGVVAQWNGQALNIRGHLVVLGAGALHTPAILLRSRGGQGLGNASGLVGAGLMRHAIDVYAVPLESGEDPAANTKEIGWNDFYYADGLKLGTVQSFGVFPPISVVLAEMLEGRERLLGRLSHWFPGLAETSSGLWRRTAGKRLFLASVLEDLPYSHNRVTLSSSGAPQLRYQLGDYETKRIALFREKMQAGLAPQKVSCLKQAKDNRRIAHVSGTCRFGSDPANSVLDAFNRVHEVDNLYVVDASFLPNSAGTNPSLTLAANALRVADHLQS